MRRERESPESRSGEECERPRATRDARDVTVDALGALESRPRLLCRPDSDRTALRHAARGCNGTPPRVGFHTSRAHGGQLRDARLRYRRTCILPPHRPYVSACAIYAFGSAQRTPQPRAHASHCPAGSAPAEVPRAWPGPVRRHRASFQSGHVRLHGLLPSPK